MKYFGISGVVAAGLLIAGAHVAQAAGDSINGEKLARIWCSACHVVSADQNSGSPDVPTFQWIARNPLKTPEKLTLFLADPHPVMPNMGLSRTEVADIVAYIGTLK